MGQYLPVFILNGYDNLESLSKIDKRTLEYFGISDINLQKELLTNIQVEWKLHIHILGFVKKNLQIESATIFKKVLLNEDQTERDSGCYSACAADRAETESLSLYSESGTSLGSHGGQAESAGSHGFHGGDAVHRSRITRNRNPRLRGICLEKDWWNGSGHYWSCKCVVMSTSQ